MSTDDQCLSVAGQFAAIQIAAETHGWQIVAQFTDEGVSGSIDPQERAQCRLALAMAKGLDCPVVVHRVDRLREDIPTHDRIPSHGSPSIHSGHH